MKLIILIFSLLAFISCNSNQDQLVSKSKSILTVDKDIRDSSGHNENIHQIDTSYHEFMMEALAPIKENLKEINDITNWSNIVSRDLNQSTEGGNAEFYILNDELIKIRTVHYGETGKSRQEFVSENGALIFVSEKTFAYDKPITWDSLEMIEISDSEDFDSVEPTIIKELSYFENGQLIRQINNQDCGSPFAKEYLKMEQVRLKNEFKLLTELLKE